MRLDVTSLGGRVRLRPLGVLAGLVAAIVAGEYAVGTVIERVVDGGGQFPAWLPHARSVGETAVIYFVAFDFLTFVVLPAVLVWVGYVHGRHHATRAGERG